MLIISLMLCFIFKHIYLLSYHILIQSHDQFRVMSLSIKLQSSIWLHSSLLTTSDTQCIIVILLYFTTWNFIYSVYQNMVSDFICIFNSLLLLSSSLLLLLLCMCVCVPGWCRPQCMWIQHCTTLSNQLSPSNFR